MKTKLILCFIAITQFDVQAIERPPIDLLAPFPVDAQPRSSSSSSSTSNAITANRSNSFATTSSPFNSLFSNANTAASIQSKPFVASTFASAHESTNARFQPIVVNPSLPRSSEYAAKTLLYRNDVYANGFYKYFFNTDNGINVDVEGEQKDAPPNKVLEERGSYSYTAPNGEVIAVRYIANENGFQPFGAHLPTPPPIPKAILRSIEYIKARQLKH